MGWYNHPDTLCIAYAQGVANKTGHKHESVEWLRAYRDAYEHIADERAKEYIQKLDAVLAAKKATPQ